MTFAERHLRTARMILQTCGEEMEQPVLKGGRRDCKTCRKHTSAVLDILDGLLGGKK